MVINISVQYNGGFLSDIILFTQGYFRWGTCIYSLCNSILLLFMCDCVLHCLCFVFTFLWCPCMAINVSAQYNSGLPNIIPLTQCISIGEPVYMP